MSTLKQSIFGVALYLIAVFILAQFDSSDAPIIDFAKYFYITAIIVLPVTALIPSVSKVNVFLPMAFWAVVYLALLQTLDRTSSAPIDSPAIILLELILVELGAWLGYQLAYGISHAESVMDAMALTAFPNRTASLDSARQQIKIEISRSRRYHRVLSLILIDPHTDNQVQFKEIIGAIQQDFWNRFSFARIGQVIDSAVRETDLVVRDTHGRFLILCPETDRENAELLAGRVGHSVQERTGLKLLWGVAVFPEDALTFDDLVIAAKDKMSQPVGGVQQEAFKAMASK